ncbi:hypothetical protein H5J25_02765 [Sphingomonas aliaeris]|uniref:Porin n=1 Tax=Sphingomonas aliaeris TaxID=2759526 RepID=A0A974NVT4_9SPHN|nr:TorF family putative porin [Sphingomonas aliaeris]QQV77722.1 hypothetical protein H5J25_02765 [Sphingomonas aliaeris]
MRDAVRLIGTIATATLGTITPAFAQDNRSATVELATEEERRGLSWSEGRAAISGDVRASIGRLDLSARAVSTRNSVRHDGADAVVDLSVGTGWDLGAVRVQTDVTGHAFVGARGRRDYVEGGVSAGYTYGPLNAMLGVIAAPSQKAIGGSNVYAYAYANAGIPGTPLTAVAEVGHSSGSVRNADRADRLRPGGSYSNWRLGLEHRRDRLTIGVDYIGTNISENRAASRYADLSNATDRIVGRVQYSF